MSLIKDALYLHGTGPLLPARTLLGLQELGELHVEPLEPHVAGDDFEGLLEEVPLREAQDLGLPVREGRGGRAHQLVQLGAELQFGSSRAF